MRSIVLTERSSSFAPLAAMPIDENHHQRSKQQQGSEHKRCRSEHNTGLTSHGNKIGKVAAADMDKIGKVRETRHGHMKRTSEPPVIFTESPKREFEPVEAKSDAAKRDEGPRRSKYRQHSTRDGHNLNRRAQSDEQIRSHHRTRSIVLTARSSSPAPLVGVPADYNHHHTSKQQRGSDHKRCRSEHNPGLTSDGGKIGKIAAAHMDKIDKIWVETSRRMTEASKGAPPVTITENLKREVEPVGTKSGVMDLDEAPCRSKRVRSAPARPRSEPAVPTQCEPPLATPPSTPITPCPQRSRTPIATQCSSPLDPPLSIPTTPCSRHVHAWHSTPSPLTSPQHPPTQLQPPQQWPLVPEWPNAVANRVPWHPVVQQVSNVPWHSSLQSHFPMASQQHLPVHDQSHRAVQQVSIAPWQSSFQCHYPVASQQHLPAHGQSLHPASVFTFPAGDSSQLPPKNCEPPLSESPPSDSVWFRNRRVEIEATWTSTQKGQRRKAQRKRQEEKGEGRRCRGQKDGTSTKSSQE